MFDSYETHIHTRTTHRICLAIDALNYLIRSMFLAQTTAFLAFYSNSNPMHRLHFAVFVDIQLNEKLALKVLALQMNRLKLKFVRYWRRCTQAPIQKQRKTRRKKKHLPVQQFMNHGKCLTHFLHFIFIYCCCST